MELWGDGYDSEESRWGFRACWVGLWRRMGGPVLAVPVGGEGGGDCELFVVVSSGRRVGDALNIMVFGQPGSDQGGSMT